MASGDDEGDNVEGLLMPVAGGADIQVVGSLSERVVELLSLPTMARSVWMHSDTVTHVTNRRIADAEFVLEHLPAAVLWPELVGVEFRDRCRIRLVRKIETHDCHLHVAIKLVSAAEAGSHTDELWISTAYRMGVPSLTRLRNKATLWRVEDV